MRNSPFIPGPRLCLCCGKADLSDRDFMTRFCRPCKKARAAATGASAAHQTVAYAVKRGLLPRASTLSCVDCGKAASNYDHRDYAKPLVVEPVCHGCNGKRGPARPVLTFELP